jgi:muramidase (phage lysozyme)
MGGKTGTTTSTTTIPPEVLARYNSVNASAEKTAATPFKEYSSDPNSFVAPLNQQQETGIGNINQYANAAQPSIAYAQQGYTPQGFQQGVQGYMNPFLQNAMGSTAAQLNNVNQQQQQQMIGSAIGQGAFGGDRANIGLGALQNQQNLALGSTLGNMASQGYQNAAQNYMTGLGQIGTLGIAGQTAGLQGAQAQLGAGTLGQQTSQAGKTALYNQFQQQQAYPFQVAQFLANIAEGTGALSGSSTTGTSPMPFFSDRRLKEDIKRVGTADNGLPIYKFKYKGDHSEQTHVGFMADEVEKVHPEAVGLAGGYKTVDYEKASEPVRHHNAFGGLNINPASTLSGAGSVGQTNQDPSILFPIEHNGGENRSPAGFNANHGYSPDTGYGGGLEGSGGNLGSAMGKMGGEVTGDSGVGGTEGQGMYAHGGLVPSSMGGHVGTEHTGEGYADGGYADYYDPNSIQNIIARHQGMYSNIDSNHVPTYRNLSGGLGKYSRVPEANLPVASLRTSGSLPAMPDSSLKQGLGAVSEAGDFATKGRDFYDWIKKQHMFDSQSSTPSAGETVNALAGQNSSVSGNARGGLVGYASGGDIPYEDTSNDGKLDIPNEKNKHALMTDKNPTGSTSQTGLGLGQALALPGEIAKLGSTASGLASGIGSAASGIGSAATAAASGIGDALSALPFLFLSGGGTVGREHHDGSEGNVVGGEGGLDGKMQYKIAPQALAEMNPVQQQIVKGIYGPESGSRYNVLNGGEEFDPSQGHPNRVGKGGQSTAAGAGQFINETWNRVTGGAPMTPAYQDAATLKLANDDYKARTGRDLQKDVSEKGFSPEVKSALAPTWTSLGQKQSPKEDNNPLAGLGKMFGIGSAQAQEQPKTKEGGLLPQTGLFSEQTVIPLLTGLGAMASSNSPYLGSALLQGIGAGAQSYLTTQQKQAAIAQTKQETDAIKAEMAKGAFVPGQRGNIIFVKGANGQVYPMGMAEYQNLRRAGRAPEPAFQPGTEGAAGTQPYQAPPSGAAAPAPVVEPTAVGGAQHPLYDAISHTEAQNEQAKFDPTVGGPAIDTNYKLSDSYIKRVAQEADAARANGRNVQELSSNLASAVTLKGGATPGPTFDARAYALGLANVAARAAGLPEVSSADSTEAIASKVNAIQSFMQAHGADQNSLGALRAATSTVPNPNMPPAAFAPLAAMLMVQQKRAVDAKNHADNWSQDSGGTYLGASKDFSRKTSQVYADDQNALAALMLKTPKKFQQFMSGRDSQGQPIDESRMTNVLKAIGYNPRVAKYFVLGE